MTVRRLAIVVTALAIASLGFLIRFNALGGSMGGFDDDEFVTLVRDPWRAEVRDAMALS